ncbi:Uncharacterized protein Rs2_18562 [Raphanus sativus]|nr:Uncharacterized protein Rs2_18562 [Raphanus sativus]
MSRVRVPIASTPEGAFRFDSYRRRSFPHSVAKTGHESGLKGGPWRHSSHLYFTHLTVRTWSFNGVEESSNTKHVPPPVKSNLDLKKGKTRSNQISSPKTPDSPHLSFVTVSPSLQGCDHRLRSVPKHR